MLLHAVRGISCRLYSTASFKRHLKVYLLMSSVGCSFQPYTCNAKKCRVLHKHYTCNATQGFPQAAQGPKHASPEKQNILILCKPDHMTNSSHVIGHFFRTLRALCACIACIRLEPCLTGAYWNVPSLLYEAHQKCFFSYLQFMQQLSVMTVLWRKKNVHSEP